MKKLSFLSITLLLCSALGFGLDFGLLLDQTVEYENVTRPDKTFTYTPSVTPWFSWNGGKGFSVYLSAKASMKYQNISDGIPENDGWLRPAVLPEISRFQFSYRRGNYSLDAGRIWYADTIGIAASGLFDGASLGMRIGSASMRVGLYYTGLQFKETAKVVMSASDTADYGMPWDYDNFGAYFASKRAMGAFRLDLPLMEYQNLSFEALAQFDLNGADESLNSQYAEAKLDFFTKNNMALSGALLFELMQTDGSLTMAFGAFASFGMEVPGALNDGLKLSLKFSSGNWNDSVAGITPISCLEQGMIFSQSIDSLFVVKAAYDARFLPSLLGEASFSYFINTGSDGLDGNLYGAELWAAIGWQPLNDLRFVLGGGAFFPFMGNIWSDADPTWKLSAALSVSF